jgi:HAD superfamily hydrolase (TIGR01509 family)
MPAVLFGSIGTVAETSELQRKAFNDAFERHGLDWNWSQDDYKKLLEQSGGEHRIAEFAEARGEEVDAAAVYATKSELYQEALASAGTVIRDGAAQTVADARKGGFKVALVTTTSRQNVEALGAAVRPEINFAEFDLVVDKSDVAAPKPDAAAYEYALAQLGEDAADCVAVENNLDGVRAAKAAGIAVVAYPGEDNADHDFAAADGRVEELSFDRLRALAAS